MWVLKSISRKRIVKMPGQNKTSEKNKQTKDYENASI